MIRRRNFLISQQNCYDIKVARVGSELLLVLLSDVRLFSFKIQAHYRY